MKKKSFLSRLRPRVPGENEPPSKNVRKATGYADKIVVFLKWLVNEKD